ncbi:MAG: ribonuclease HII, partial [Ignavibacteriae bacterium]|nr:ribonuclease HII [Ignavibacteriota bacterium]
MLDFHFERRWWKSGIEYIAGVDEAGRGPLAGPVVAAAVMFPTEVWIHGVNDSKKLSPGRREELFDVILRSALNVRWGIIPHDVIDEVNIYQATMRAMTEAVSQLNPTPQHVLVDGPRFRGMSFPNTAVVDGDAQCFSIAAASIVAKVVRDTIMVEYDKQFPHYGFAQHKGYATPQHLEALRKHG